MKHFNNKPLIRIFALLLLLSMLIPAIVACSDGAVDETNAPVETDEPYPDDMGDEVYFPGDNTVRFISATERTSIALSEEDKTGDIVNDALWRRNLAIENRFNVKIELVDTTGYGEFSKTVSTSINAQSDDYDVLCGHTRFNINLAANGLLKNLNNVEYLDFTKNYWSSLYMENISYNDIDYWATGDLTLNFLNMIFVMFGNNSVWTDFYGDPDPLFSLVNEGGWTLDKMVEYARGVYQDLNGNQALDPDDRYGLAMATGHQINAMFFASGVKYTSRDKSGEITMTVNNDHTIAVFNKLHDIMYGSDNFAVYKNEEYDGTTLEQFIDDRLLFMNQTLGSCGGEKMRAMESDFFVIPNPKFNEEQESYVASQYDGVPIYGIPVTVDLDRVDMVGALLEGMCSMTNALVLETYYDDALKNKYSRNPRTAEMIDLIHDSVAADFAYAWGDRLGAVVDFFYTNLEGGNISSALAGRERGWTRQMGELLEELIDNNQN